MKTKKENLIMKVLMAFLLLGASSLSVTARVENYGLEIAGVQVTSENYYSVQAPEGSNAIIKGVSYNHLTNTLTLNNAIIDAREVGEDWGASGINSLVIQAGLTIKLIGKSTVYSDYIPVYSRNVLNIVSGEAGSSRPQLNIVGSRYDLFPGIEMCSNAPGGTSKLNIEGCDVDIVGEGCAIKGYDNYGNETYDLVALTIGSDASLRVKTKSSSSSISVFKNVKTVKYDGLSIIMPKNASWSESLMCFTKNGTTPIAAKEARIASYIDFEDAAVKNICVANWDGNSDGRMDRIEARLVTSLENKFEENTQIQRFNELKYFTGIASMEAEFDLCSNLTAVELPGYVEHVGNFAFYRTSLSSVTIPWSVESIGASAFQYCDYLTKVQFEEGSLLKSIGAEAFSMSWISEMTLPDCVETIGELAFWNNSLTTLTIPSTVKSIGDDAFVQANEPTALFEKIIVKGSTPATIGEDIFGGTESGIMGYLNKNRTKIYVPAGTLSTYQQAWPQYKDFMVEEVGYDIYIAGHELTENNVGPNKEFVYADGNTTVKGVYYDPQSETLTLDNAIIKTSAEYPPAIEIGYNMHAWNTVSIKLFGSSTIESRGTGIMCYGGLAFVPKTYNTYDLEAMKLTINSKNSCIYFENWDISSMPSLSMTYGNYELSSTNSTCIYGGSEFDPDDPFGFQPGELASATFINVVMRATAPGHQVMTNISSYEFKDCQVVHPAHCSTPNGAYDEVRIGKWISFSDEDTEAVCIYYWDDNGDGGLDKWEAAAVATIDEAFRGNEEVEDFGELRYFTGITEIPDNAFKGCTNLSWIDIPSNVTRIGNHAFDGTSLFCPDIPNGVEEIGDYAFSGCTWESNFSIPYSVKTIGEHAFSGCAAMGGVWFSEQNQDKYQLETIGAYAFSGFGDDWGNGPVNIIPQSVKYIGDYAFSGSSSCLQLTAYGEQPPVIGDHVFGTPPFDDEYYDSYIIVPDGKVSIYKRKWAEYKDYILGEEDPIATGIDQMADTKQKANGVYTLDGRFLRKGSSTEGLAKGIYIVNGKKVAVK